MHSAGYIIKKIKWFMSNQIIHSRKESFSDFKKISKKFKNQIWKTAYKNAKHEDFDIWGNNNTNLFKSYWLGPS